MSGDGLLFTCVSRGDSKYSQSETDVMQRTATTVAGVSYSPSMMGTTTNMPVLEQSCPIADKIYRVEKQQEQVHTMIISIHVK